MSQDLLFSQASNTLATMLRGQKVDDALANVDKVEIFKAAAESSSNMVRANHMEELTFIVSGASAKEAPFCTAEAFMNVLRQASPLSEQHVTFDNQEKQGVVLHEELQQLVDKGLVPKNYLESPFFDTKLNGPHATWVEDFAVSEIHSDEKGVNLSLRVPSKETAVYTKVADNLRGRTDEIKEAICELTCRKHIGSASDEDKQKLRNAIKAMDISVEQHQHGDFGNVKITLRSPKQVEEAAKPKDGRPALTETQKVELRDSNPIVQLINTTKMDNEKLGKLLARSILESGPKAEEIFPLVAGRKDMQKRILRLTKDAVKDAEVKKTVDAIVNHNFFKLGGGRENTTSAEEQRHKPINYASTKDANGLPDGKLKLSITVPRGESEKILKEIAALHQKELGMVQVNDVQLLGVSPTTDALKLPEADRKKLLDDVALKAQKILAQFNGVNLPQNDPAKITHVAKADPKTELDVERTVQEVKDKMAKSFGKMNGDVASLFKALPINENTSKWANLVKDQGTKGKEAPGIA